MLVAIDEHGTRVHIQDAEVEAKYYCPLCQGELIQKHGSLRIWHYAHKNGADECDHWHYDMSDWHMEWQNMFDQKCQEVVMIVNGVKHRADVVVNDKIVVEFQHSPLSPEEFNERNDFYTSNGYLVYWVFDTVDQWGLTIQHDLFGGMGWSHSFNALRDYKDCRGKVKLYLQKDKNTVVSIKNVDPVAGVRSFDAGFEYTKDEFVEHIKNIGNLRASGLFLLTDRVYAAEVGGHEKALINCPKSEENVHALEDGWPCYKCSHSKGADNSFKANYVCRCCYRFRELIPVIKKVDDVKMDDTDQTVVRIEYTDIEGYKRSMDFGKIEPVGKPLAEVWNDLNPSTMRCVNVKTGYMVQVNRSPSEQMEQYGDVKGNAVDLKTLRRYPEFKTIHYANASQWILTWYKD